MRFYSVFLPFFRTLLQVLVYHSLPPAQTKITAGTKMPELEENLESGESEFCYNSLLPRDRIFPLASSAQAKSFVTQYFRDGLANEPDLLFEIGSVAKGHIQRSAKLVEFIWHAKPKKDAQLRDYVKSGIESLKGKIMADIERQ